MMRFLPALLLAACATGTAEPLDPDAPPADATARTGADVDVQIVAGPTPVPSPAEPLVPAVDVEAARTATADVQPGDTITTAEPDLAHGPVPASVAPVESLLRARHAADLPDRQTLDAHADADDALVWLSLHGSTAAVRVRATSALGQYPEGGHADHLASLFLADDTHPALRAAALSALAEHDAETRRRYVGIVRPLAENDDPRVSGAAGRALQGL